MKVNKFEGDLVKDIQGMSCTFQGLWRRYTT